MKRSRKPVLLAAIAALLASFATAQMESASAWLDIQCKFTTSTLKWQDSTTRPGYSGPAHDAIDAWYATPTPLVLTQTTTAENLTVTDGNFGDTGFDGITYKTCQSGYNTTAPTAWVNRHYTDSYSAVERKSLFVHEIGHTFGLGDTTAGSCTNVEIMQFNTATRWDSCRKSVPQAGDINGINALY